MTWERTTEQSRRSQELPPGWRTIRARVLKRDGYRCQIRGNRCTGAATEADHIVRGADHRDENLRGACRPCHTQRSGRDGATASVAARRARIAARKRPQEPHPGRMDPEETP